MMRYLLIALLAACSSAPPSTTSSSKPAAGGDGLVAFETMRAVFQHPRCQNCHPAGDVPLQGDASTPHKQNVQRGPDGTGGVGLGCTTCHGAANPPASYGEHIPPGTTAPWRMPPANNPMVFVGASPRALCEQIEDPTKNGGRDLAALRHHLDDPLVTWAWDPGVGRAPVPTPRADFVRAFETWASAGAPCPP